MIYLASPYTPHSGESVQERTDVVARVAARLMQQGNIVFTPIVHSHYIADYLPDALRLDHEFWMRQDLPILRRSDKLVVLCLPGWERSRGVRREIEAATAVGLPVEYLYE